MKYLNENNLLFEKQHGFRSKLSCETQLIEFSADVLKVLQANQQCDSIVMDFSKAFDKVSHNRLIYKLHENGIDKTTINWIKSFLSDRSQKVIIDGDESDSIKVTSGVPQGSVLGPILFLIFIDDLARATEHCKTRLFADDTIIYLTISKINDCNKLQKDIQRLENWERDSLMEFHPEKCQVLRITRKRNTIKFPYKLHNHILEEVSSAKYLGLNVSNKLCWNNHIEKTAAKANKKLGFLKRNLKISSQDFKAKAYKAIIRPTLEYCGTVWDPFTLYASNVLEMVQRRAARWVLRSYHNTSSVTAMLKSLGWRDLSQRRVDSRLIMIYKIINNLVDIDRASYIKLQRNNLNLQPIQSTTLYYKFSFFPRTIADLRVSL